MTAETTAPTTWKVSRLGDVTEISSGVALGRKLRGRTTRPVPYLRVANVKEGRLDLTEVKQTEATEEEIRDCRLAPGDILLTEGGDRDKLGRGTFWEGQVPECIHQNHIFRVRSDPSRFDPSFLAFQFGSSYGKAYFLRHAKQTTGIASINKTVLSNFPLLIPPLPEQRRIAALLCDQLAEVAQARATVQAQLDAVRKLPAGHLRAVFTSAAAVNWPRQPLGKLCDLLASKSVALSADTNVRTITSACLNELRFNPAGIKPARMWAADVPEATVRPGEILVSRSNTPELVGRASLVPSEPGGIVASDLTIRIWPKDVMTNEFLARYLSFLFVTGYWIDRAGGASGTMKKITRAQIEAEPIPVPPLEVQQFVTTRLADEMTQSSQLQSAISDRRAALDRLPAALLRCAFAAESE